MGKVRISVALASYNGENYIREQMDSILANLSGEDEIVVSDDGSKDCTLEILKEYEEGRVPVKVLKGPGKGIKKNIENAMRNCQGEYIFLADQDDVWREDKVEFVMPFLEKGCTLVNHDARVMDGELKNEIMPSFFTYRNSGSGFLRNFVKNRYMGCCMAFHRKLLPLVLPIPDEIEMHDQWIGLINDITGGESVFLRQPLLLYRRHEKNVSDFNHGTVPEMVKKRWILAKALLRWRKLGKY
ncbi:MAG: glycosyltransferase family 2 protein [Roseburia sp.]|nr:glycosyltransferase family 2 protein [Roseburia sp.]